MYNSTINFNIYLF